MDFIRQYKRKDLVITMRMIDLIEKKRDGYKLNKDEIDFIIQGYTKGEIPDYQVSAFLMATYLKGMDDEEATNMAISMLNSGDKLDLSEIPGVKVDKHSTGGVGDKTSLVLAPLVASFGVNFAKMSGRGLGHTGGTLDKLDEAANAVGYKLVDYNGDYRLYHLDVNGNWGTISTYEAIGIGSGASGISLRFPAVEETDSYNLDDYTFEQLSQYKEIFLDGFTYNDKEAAEELIIRLSEAGVKIIISADSIPQDKRTHTQTFLGVTCNAVKFENGYPEMNTRIGRVYTDMFPQGHTEWNTVYLDGLDTVWGTFYDNGLNLDFYGTVNLSLIHI